jgi:hypothetical protein
MHVLQTVHDSAAGVKGEREMLCRKKRRRGAGSGSWGTPAVGEEVGECCLVHRDLALDAGRVIPAHSGIAYTKRFKALESRKCRMSSSRNNRKRRDVSMLFFARFARGTGAILLDY